MTNWKDDINVERSGAVYFLSQPSRPKFSPSEYIESRGLRQEDSHVILREWNRWIKDLMNSRHSFIREAAKAAGLMKAADLDKFYEKRIVAKRKLDVLKSSSEQLKDADQNLARQIKKGVEESLDSTETTDKHGDASDVAVVDRPKFISEEQSVSLPPTRVLLKRGRTSKSGIASITARHGGHQPPEHDVNDGARTPPRNVQGYCEEIPLAKDLEAVFRHVDISANFLLREADQRLYDDASKWFKAKIKTSTELTIAEMRTTRFQEDWIHDLLYYRLILLRAGLNPNVDENTYTSFWVSPDFFALQTGVQGLISSGFVNENHFGPSAWRRSLARGTQSSK
ncbi:hypothetical protein BX616_006954, partial [Lobosporangium transversale]